MKTRDPMEEKSAPRMKTAAPDGRNNRNSGPSLGMPAAEAATSDQRAATATLALHFNVALGRYGEHACLYLLELRLFIPSISKIPPPTTLRWVRRIARNFVPPSSSSAMTRHMQGAQLYLELRLCLPSAASGNRARGSPHVAPHHARSSAAHLMLPAPAPPPPPPPRGPLAGPEVGAPPPRRERAPPWLQSSRARAAGAL